MEVDPPSGNTDWDQISRPSPDLKRTTWFNTILSGLPTRLSLLYYIELRKIEFRSRLGISQMNSSEILVVFVVLLQRFCLAAPVVAFMMCTLILFGLIWRGLIHSVLLPITIYYPCRVLSKYRAIHPFGDWTTTPAVSSVLVVTVWRWRLWPIKLWL